MGELQRHMLETEVGMRFFAAFDVNSNAFSKFPLEENMKLAITALLKFLFADCSDRHFHCNDDAHRRGQIP